MTGGLLTSPRVAAAAVALTCAAAAGWLFQVGGDARRVRSAGAAIAAGDYRAAERLTAEVTHTPAAAQALLLRGIALGGQGRFADADAVLARAARRDPNNWYVHQQRATVLLALGDVAGARREWRRVAQLNPRFDPTRGY